MECLGATVNAEDWRWGEVHDVYAASSSEEVL